MENISNNKFDMLTKDDLFQMWNEAVSAYYGDMEEAIMSDEDFDELTEILREFNDEKINQSLNGIYSDGTDSVESVSSNKTVMISLKKIKMSNNPMGVQEIFKHLSISNSSVCYKAPKFDGMSIKISIDIIIGEITRCQTRGGQDVTDKLINHHSIKSLPQKYPGCSHIHGELAIRKTTFEKYFSDGVEYENIRNCVPGILKKKTEFEIDKLLDFVECTDGISPLLDAELDGQPIWTKIEERVDWNRIEESFHKWKSPDFPYQIDGVVVGFLTTTQIVKDNYPMNLVALKFKGKSVKTKVIDIVWQQKKTGKLIPVLIIQPTELDGTTCQRANGYNYANLKMKHCGVGAEITIIKTGDIIPVVDVVLTRSDNFKMPDVDYSIEGKHCVAIDKEASRMYKFVLGLRLLQIDGIGPKLASEIGKVCDYDIIELFSSMHRPAIRQILGGGVNWQKFETFYNIKNLYLDQLIEMLQFDGCGKILSQRFALIISKQSKDTRGIDKNVLAAVCTGDGFALIKDSIARLKEFGVAVLKPIDINDSAVVTYEMSNPPKSGITKDEFMRRFKERCPKSMHTTLTKTTNYLFCDDVNGNSGKINKARKYNVTIMSYEDALIKTLEE